ncbi:g11397 [Coccomyxa elongata]
MSGALAAIRRTLTQAPKLSRSLQTGRTLRGGGHHDEPHYVHAEHMYETWNIKNAKLKWGVATTVFVVAGFGLPVVAITYSNNKTKQ